MLAWFLFSLAFLFLLPCPYMVSFLIGFSFLPPCPCMESFAWTREYHGELGLGLGMELELKASKGAVSFL